MVWEVWIIQFHSPFLHEVWVYQVVVVAQVWLCLTKIYQVFHNHNTNQKRIKLHLQLLVSILNINIQKERFFFGN